MPFFEIIFIQLKSIRNSNLYAAENRKILCVGRDCFNFYISYVEPLFAINFVVVKIKMKIKYKKFTYIELKISHNNNNIQF